MFGPNDGIRSKKDVFLKNHVFLDLIFQVAPRNSDDFALGLTSVRFNGAEL